MRLAPVLELVKLTRRACLVTRPPTALAKFSLFMALFSPAIRVTYTTQSKA